MVLSKTVHLLRLIPVLFFAYHVARVPAPVVQLPLEAEAPDWLPQVMLEDHECRRPMSNPVIDWSRLRENIKALLRASLDPLSMHHVEGDQTEAERKHFQLELLTQGVTALTRFEASLMECPLGTVTISLFVACLAHLPRGEVSDGELSVPQMAALTDFARTPFVETASRDLLLLLDLVPVYIAVASEWQTFSILHLYIGKVSMPPPPHESRCLGTSVSGHTSEKIYGLLKSHVHLASGRNMQGLKYLRGLDPMISSVMRDPTEFSREYVEVCPAGAATFAVAAAMLALMSNPSLFEKFSSLSHYVLRIHTHRVLLGARHWGTFHALAKMQGFSLRQYDLVWSMQELLRIPLEASAFDALRLDSALRAAHLGEATELHEHMPTRHLASFLRMASARQARVRDHQEVFVYLTAVGGYPFTDYLDGFIRRAVAVDMPALVIACMDREALSKCVSLVGRLEDRVYCLPAVEGHVILIKHAFIPILLSAAVDVVWIDFDTFVLRDPTAALIDARDNPAQVLPQRSRVRFGSFIFHSGEDMCSLTKVCDKRQHWEYNIGGGGEPWERPDGGPIGVEVLVTEHWDARCLNNGLFYVRSNHRTLAFFTLFLSQLYANPYTDNQNLFDAFLSHTSVDAAAPDARPLIRYALLDIERRFACAEGHLGQVRDLVTFHFWSSDFRTQEAPTTREAIAAAAKDGEGESQGSAIKMRDGVVRVSKPVMASKSELFELFLGLDAEVDTDVVAPDAAAFIEKVKAPPPNWRGMCAVTAVGIEELVDERMLQGSSPQLVDWEKVTKVAEAEAFESQYANWSTTAPIEQELGMAVEASSVVAPIPLHEWVLGMQAIADLEDQAMLLPAEAASAKARLRNLDAGFLIVLQAFAGRGSARLAQELRQALQQEPA